MVNAPALYIQEKVHPKALIADLMRQSKENREPAERQIDMFAELQRAAGGRRPAPSSTSTKATGRTAWFWATAYR